MHGGCKIYQSGNARQRAAKLHILSTLKTDLIFWHLQLIVPAVKQSRIACYTFQCFFVQIHSTSNSNFSVKIQNSLYAILLKILLDVQANLPSTNTFQMSFFQVFQVIGMYNFGRQRGMNGYFFCSPTNHLVISYHQMSTIFVR